MDELEDKITQACATTYRFEIIRKGDKISFVRCSLCGKRFMSSAYGIGSINDRMNIHFVRCHMPVLNRKW